MPRTQRSHPPLPPPVSLNARTVNVSYQTSTISRGEVNSSFPKCGGHVKLRVYPETNLSGWPLTPSPLLGAYLSHVFQPASNRFIPLLPSSLFALSRLVFIPRRFVSVTEFNDSIASSFLFFSAEDDRENIFRPPWNFAGSKEDRKEEFEKGFPFSRGFTKCRLAWNRVFIRVEYFLSVETVRNLE